MSVMGVPVMTKASFIHTERCCGRRHCNHQWLRLDSRKGVKGSFHEGVLSSLSLLMEAGASVPTGIPTMPSLGWQSSLVRRRESYSSSESTTNTATHVPEGLLRKITLASGIGAHRHLRWRRTLSWRGFLRLSGCTEFATHSSLEMVTTLCIQLSSRMFLDGAMSSKSLSVPTMHVSVIGAHSRGQPLLQRQWTSS